MLFFSTRVQRVRYEKNASAMSPTFHARLINVTKNVSPAAACSVTIFSIKNQLRRTSSMKREKSFLAPSPSLSPYEIIFMCLRSKYLIRKRQQSAVLPLIQSLSLMRSQGKEQRRIHSAFFVARSDYKAQPSGGLMYLPTALEEPAPAFQRILLHFN